jgi:hypothetical protein
MLSGLGVDGEGTSWSMAAMIVMTRCMAAMMVMVKDYG